MATRNQSGCFRDLVFNGLAHPMDERNPNGLVSVVNWRICLNVAATEPNSVFRMGGWRRLFADSEYGFWNQDLHDQLLCLSSFHDTLSIGYYDLYEGFYDLEYCGADLYIRDGCREPVTKLFQFTTAESRKLIAFTESRIYELNERRGNWRIIADGLGSRGDDEIGPCEEKIKCDCGLRRWQVVKMGGYMIATNNLNPVLAYRAGDAVSGCELTAGFAIPELVALGVIRARTVSSWKGFITLGGVEDDAGLHASRLMWSDYNSPLEYDTAPSDTLAGVFELPLDEVILADIVLGDNRYIFTDGAIWQAILVTQEQGLIRFRELYRGGDVPRFPCAIIETGEAILWLGETTIYQLTPENPKPQLIDWLDLAAGYIFKGLAAVDLGAFPHLQPFGPINRDACEVANGWYDPLEKCAWFSWPTDDNTCPNMSLRLDLKQSFSSLVDKGFTAGLSFRPDPRPTVADFFAEWQVCQLDEWPLAAKEGDPIPSAVNPFPNPPLWIFNSAEDPSLPIDPDSLCARWGNLRLQDICEKCDADPVLVLADADDFTLKQYEATTYYRELYDPTGVCAGAAFTVTSADGAVYCAYGYSSLMQSDLDKLGLDTEKLINKAVVDFEAEVQTTPNKLAFQIAVSGQPKCSTWNSLDSQDIACASSGTVAEHEAANTRPAGNAKFPAFLRGRYVGWRFYVESPDEVSTITGGGICFNALTISIRNTQTQAAW